MLSELLDQIRNAIVQHGQQQGGNLDAGQLINQVEGLFTQHAANTGQPPPVTQGGWGGVLPASQDPYGDPAGQRGGWSGGGGVLPASQDPYGDPADRAGGILPASADPLGDPADQR